MPSTPEISVEIQKGVDLFMEGCFNSLKPFVKVSLEPLGPSFSTAPGEKYLPEWYKVIQIKQSLHNFETLKIAVAFKEDEEKEVELGSCGFRLVDLEDQRIREGWYELEMPKKKRNFFPQLQLRIQLVHDEKALYTLLLVRSNKLTERVQELLASNEI